MPKLTPEQLQEARKAKAEERKARAEADAAAREAQEQTQQNYVERTMGARDRCRQLQSVVDGLYEEHDKLARKWPTMAVTPRSVDRVNKALSATRTLLAGEADDFVEGLDDIVAAGDPPETRDVVVMLREVKDALRRFEASSQDEWRRIEREYDWE